MRLNFIYLLLIICFCFLQNCSYSTLPKVGIGIFDEMLREGDIIFRQGIGLTSHIVRAADGSGTYSHAGIVARGKNGWLVIHAVPDEPEYEGDEDRVKAEKVSDFFSPEKAACGAVMRVSVDSVIAAKASRHAWEIFARHTLFDHLYDLNDTTKMYCTELVWFVFHQEGILLVHTADNNNVLPLVGKACILPDDLANSPLLTPISTFEY